jgi:2-dehydro-3-deoxyphosphogluconate aldolase/(4S)-4-hydroxy-2-oxoglutarate aldolase
MTQHALASSLAVLRGYTPVEAAALAAALWDAGLDLVEVSILSERDWACFEAVFDRAAHSHAAGVGSLRSAADVRRACDAGARFAVTPGFSRELVDAARDAGLELIPGVLTPSEVLGALELGCATVKLFPASAVGPDYVRALLGPFPELRIIAVGGIDADNARSFLEAGAVGVALGSSMLPRPGFGPDELLAVRSAIELLGGPLPTDEEVRRPCS